jgi:hypothetical protein
MPADLSVWDLLVTGAVLGVLIVGGVYLWHWYRPRSADVPGEHPRERPPRPTDPPASS